MTHRRGACVLSHKRGPKVWSAGKDWFCHSWCCEQREEANHKLWERKIYFFRKWSWCLLGRHWNPLQQSRKLHWNSPKSLFNRRIWFFFFIFQTSISYQMRLKISMIYTLSQHISLTNHVKNVWVNKKFTIVTEERIVNSKRVRAWWNQNICCSRVYQISIDLLQCYWLRNKNNFFIPEHTAK